LALACVVSMPHSPEPTPRCLKPIIVTFHSTGISDRPTFFKAWSPIRSNKAFLLTTRSFPDHVIRPPSNCLLRVPFNNTDALLPGVGAKGPPEFSSPERVCTLISTLPGCGLRPETAQRKGFFILPGGHNSILRCLWLRSSASNSTSPLICPFFHHSRLHAPINGRSAVD